jgi:hypothetical protein
MSRKRRENRRPSQAPQSGEPSGEAGGGDRHSQESVDGTAAREESPPGSVAPRSLLTGAAPREVLKRLIEGDPFGLEARARDYLAETALMLDVERLYLRTAARIAYASYDAEAITSVSGFLRECMEVAAEDLLSDDLEAQRCSAPVEPTDARFSFLAESLGVRPEVARKACVVFNGLPPIVRRAYWALVVEGRSMSRCISLGLGTRSEVENCVKRAVLAISLLEDPGPEEPT